MNDEIIIIPINIIMKIIFLFSELENKLIPSVTLIIVKVENKMKNGIRGNKYRFSGTTETTIISEASEIKIKIQL